MSDNKNTDVIYIKGMILVFPNMGISNNVEKRFYKEHCRKISQILIKKSPQYENL